MDSSIASGMFVDVIEQIAQAQECRVTLEMRDYWCKGAERQN